MISSPPPLQYFHRTSHLVIVPWGQGLGLLATGICPLLLIKDDVIHGATTWKPNVLNPFPLFPAWLLWTRWHDCWCCTGHRHLPQEGRAGSTRHHGNLCCQQAWKLIAIDIDFINKDSMVDSADGFDSSSILFCSEQNLHRFLAPKPLMEPILLCGRKRFLEWVKPWNYVITNNMCL